MRPSLLALALAMLAAPAAAQVVTGRVVEQGTEAPMGSAVVALVDSAERRVQATLADSAGRFTLRAPGAGRYAVRVERVGSATLVSAPQRLAAGDSVDLRLTLAPAARLSAIRVTARERCRLRPEDGEITARLWDEARKALLGTTLEQARPTLPTRLSRFTRAIDPDTRRLRRETWRLLPRGNRLYRSPSAEELAEHGFVRRPDAAGDSATYFAPDAEVLLSDAFLGAHCLRAVDAPPARVGQLGLAIEPVSRRRPRLPDVKGTLWIDTSSFELHDFEFSYTDLPSGLPSGPAGGRVIFARTADGVWYVDHWVLTMPSEERVTFLRGTTPGLHAPSAIAARETGVVPSVAEEGGRSIVPNPVRRALGWATTISGSVVDSSAGAAPIVGARVRLIGTPYEAVTDDDGEFYLEVPLVGAYRVDVSTPRATSLGLAWDSSVQLNVGRQLRIEAAVPTTPTLRRLQCGDSTGAALPLLVGLVQTWRGQRGEAPTRVTLAGAPVEIEWRLPEWPATWRERRTVRTDPRGRFLVCDLPAGAEFAIHATRGSLSSEPWTGRAEAGAVLTQDLVLASARP